MIFFPHITSKIREGSCEEVWVSFGGLILWVYISNLTIFVKICTNLYFGQFNVRVEDVSLAWYFSLI